MTAFHASPLNETAFHETDVPDQSGRTAVVTGATGGLGLRVAEVLAARGAHVLLGSRNAERGEAALATVSKVATGRTPELVTLDLASLESVRAAVTDIRGRTGDRVDLLINNGGIMAPPLGFSVDGFELQWATNVLGPAVLTWLLLPTLEAPPAPQPTSTQTSRVVFVSSTRHVSATLDESRVRADLRGDTYRGFDYYGRTKLADLLLSHELDRHFCRADAQSISVAAHPGFTATGIVHSGFAGLPAPLRPIAAWGMGALGQSVAIGALPILYAATAQEVAGDDYFGPRSLGGLRGYPGNARRSPASHDDELGEMLVRVISESTSIPSPG
jgi:NAD(P)-dependent dehydrogenase (short-subunit alcohol dehydrogenase family)